MGDRALASLRDLLELPRLEQPAALAALRARVEIPEREAWNTTFGPGSLYAAWSGTRLMAGLYTANRSALRAALPAGRPWRVLEVGGGDGRLWRGLDGLGPGEVVCVDPVAEVHDQVARALPQGVALTSVVARVEDATLPDADLAIASLVLHHIAGRDAKERAAHGLSGPGKVEILARLGEAVRGRGGRVLVNEADIHCDLAVAAGDAVLRDRLLDSYVRRCARALVHEANATPEGDLRDRLRAIVWTWCVDQVSLADVPAADRDVYELDVHRWLEVFDRAGLACEQRAFTDPWGLFCRYQLTPRCNSNATPDPAKRA